MSQKARTKEQRFLMKVYQEAADKGDDIDDVEVNPVVIGELLGYGEKGIKTILNVLAQANFIRKRGQDAISLTMQGQSLANELLG